MGTCLTVTKLTSISCLGVITGVLLQDAFSGVPFLVQLTKRAPVNEIKAATKKLISKTRLVVAGLGTIASVLLAMSFFKAPPRERHPYLLYSALGAPAAAITLLSGTGPAASVLLTEVVTKSETEERSQLDDSVYQTVGDDDVDADAEKAVVRAKMSVDLEKIATVLKRGCWVSGGALGIALIGWLGE